MSQTFDFYRQESDEFTNEESKFSLSLSEQKYICGKLQKCYKIYQKFKDWILDLRPLGFDDDRIFYNYVYSKYLKFSEYYSGLVSAYKNKYGQFIPVVSDGEAKARIKKAELMNEINERRENERKKREQFYKYRAQEYQDYINNIN